MSDEFGGEINDAPEPVEMDSGDSGPDLSDGSDDMPEEPSVDAPEDNADDDNSDESNDDAETDSADEGNDTPNEPNDDATEDGADADADSANEGNDTPDEPNDNATEDGTDGADESNNTPDEPNDDTTEDDADADADSADEGNDTSNEPSDNISEENADADDSEAGNDKCYGHGGDNMETYDTYASYPESHFSETDDRYMDEHAEATEKTNERARRELEEFQRMQDEEAELEEAEVQRQAEMEAEQEVETQNESNSNLNDNYKVFVDGKEFDINKNPLEGTKEQIGHYEYEDAQLANDIQWAEDYKSATEGFQTSDGLLDAAKSHGDMSQINNDYKENKANTEKLTDYMRWSRNSYTEDYNPDN